VENMARYIYIILILIFASCSDDNLLFDIGSKYIDEEMNIFFTDTVTVSSYTVKLDSIATSGYKRAIVGSYSDEIFGNVRSRSFITVNRPPNVSIPFDAVYDSLQIILHYNGYYIGDTTKTNTIRIYRVEQTQKVSSGSSLYNTSVFEYSEEEYGSLSYLPRPFTKDTLRIRLPDSLGEQLFNAFKSRNEIVSDQANFQNFLKGFVIDYDESDESIIGFHASETMAIMQLYYHYFDYEQVKKDIDFTVYNTNAQFNQISSDNFYYELPDSQRDKLPVSLTEGASFLQAGTGIFTRLEIPHLKNILELSSNIVVLRAELEIQPLKNSYTKNSLPDSISLFQTNDINQFISPIYNYNKTSLQIAALTVDELFHENTSYTFDVTDFITSRLRAQTDEVPALLVTISPNLLYYTTENLILGSGRYGENKVILKLFCSRYD